MTTVVTATIPVVITNVTTTVQQERPCGREQEYDMN